MKKNKNLIIGILIVIAIVGGVMYLKKNKNTTNSAYYNSLPNDKQELMNLIIKNGGWGTLALMPKATQDYWNKAGVEEMKQKLVEWGPYPNATPTTDKNQLNFSPPADLAIIGPYNYNTKKTWIYNGYANGGGYWVNGYAGQEGQTYYGNAS